MDKTTEVPLRAQEDVVLVRQMTRSHAVAMGLSLVEQTKFVTAASELARNTVIHGGGGKVCIETVTKNGRKGLRLTFEDRGPGIADIEQAMRDGYSTGSGMGLGLGGSKRLASEFRIESSPGVGTKVTITHWGK